MAKLAIKGHETRGKEVIEILEMLGGKNVAACTGANTNKAYVLASYGFIDIIDYVNLNSPEYYLCVFTLEEFLEKFPYKVGDKAKLDGWPCVITEMSWGYDDVVYSVKGIDFSKRVCSKDLQPYKEETMEEEGETFGECIEKTIDICLFGKKETIDRKYNVEEYLKVWKETDKGLEVVVNDRFELKEDNGKFYLIKKQIHYPATIEECANLLNTLPHTRNGVNGYSSHALWKLQQLLICRDAYWKIAGEQMSLGKPWKPDWLNTEQDKFVLYTHNNVICLNRFVLGHNVIAFPTEEMRDAFFENFKDLIEECKEFL